MKERLTLAFLVLLRIAIGWHFLFEGVEKHRTVEIGESVLIGKPSSSEAGKPWTCEGYFREGNGPLAKAVKSRIGDPDDLLLARLTVRDLAADEDPTHSPPYRRMPELLDKDWDDFLKRFITHYGLDENQQELAGKVQQQEKDQFVLWMTVRPGSVGWLLSGLWTDHERTSFKRSYPSGTYEVDITVAERVQEYRDKVEQYRSLQGEKLYTMGKDVEKARRGAVRVEMMALRSELQGLLDKRTDEMKKSLADALLTKEQIKEKGPVPAAKRHWLIRYIDFMTPWGLMILGGCLLLGLFSRTAAVGGAIFLIMTLLTHPPLPWLPVPPNTEGNYVFISKNVIELIALLMLACIPSGRWFGLDALIHAISPWRKKDHDE